MTFASRISTDNSSPMRRRVALFALQLVPSFLVCLALYGWILPIYERLVLPAVNLVLTAVSMPLLIRRAEVGDDLSAFVLDSTAEPSWLVTMHTPEGIFLSLILAPALLLATPAPLRRRLGMLVLGLTLLYVLHVASVATMFTQLYLYSRHELGPMSSWFYALTRNSGQIGAVVIWALLTGSFWFPKDRQVTP